MKVKSIRTFIATSTLIILAPFAFAHTGLVYTTPAADSQVMTAPEELELVFGGELRLMRLELQDASGAALPIDFKPVTAPARRFKAGLPSLPAGNYTTTWMAMGADGHKMDGSFRFTVGAGDGNHGNHGSGHNGHAAGHSH